MTKLCVPNEIDAVARPSELEKHLPDGVVKTRYSVSFQLGRGESQETVVDVDNSDVVELELDDGQRIWTRVDDLKRDFGVSLTRSSDDSDEFRIPLELPSRSYNRGVGNWVIKGLKVLGVDIAGSIGDFVTEKVESKQTPAPGLYRCTVESVTALQPVTSLDKSKPILVFIHGTASSTEGSFGALWQAGASHLSDLSNHYGGQILAFQHRSLSQSPVENALALLETLNELPSTVHGKFPLRLHLVSHSRGGLIGELLCRGTREGGSAFDKDDHELFAHDSYARDKAALEQLGAALDKAELRVERFMRVACPARGTTLADGRLDRYLSGIVNILDKIPGVSNPVFDGISSLMLAVVHKRTEPEDLPGLEAMMPTSPTVRMLNRPDITVAADLHVIGGDVMASGLFNRLKVLITDLFYREDHDLVVNTPSMFGGAKRSAGVRYWIDTGGKVDHFRYFGNSSTVSRLAAGLRQSDTKLFHSLSAEPHLVTEDDYRKRSIDPQPIVFVLPGIMGSHLSVDGDRVWLDYLTIACGGMTRLGMDAEAEVQPNALLSEAYGELMKHLAVTHDVRPFPYDWRVSIDRSAELLRKAIEPAVDEAEKLDQPVRIIAHSMGGLVVRAMLATDQGLALWKRMGRHPGSRFIMLGVPNGGSHAIAAMLMGRDALARKLALLDIRHDQAELLQTIHQFDGALQLLPHSGTLDLYERDSWSQLHKHDVPDNRGVFSKSAAGSKSAGIGWSIPDLGRLSEAGRLRQQITDSPIDSERMIYVAGLAPETPIDITIDTESSTGYQVQVHATAEGDGRVPWSTGIPAELSRRNVYYMDALHGDLAATQETFRALEQLLHTGTTQQLSNTPILHRGHPGETFILPPAVADMYPNQADLVAAALCGSHQRRRVAQDKCHVRIVHGDLGRARFPVTVGHYLGDTIISAEAYLDRQLLGRLRDRHRLGIYPGEIGTSTILLNQPDQQVADRPAIVVHPGAIIVGLGTVGDLTPGDLTDTLVEGLMRYALEIRDTAVKDYRRLQAEPPRELSAPLTSLLISASNYLTVSDSLRCILRAVATVNKRLQPPELNEGVVSPLSGKPHVRIDQLDIVEYWEDRALQAARALINLAGTQEFDSFDFHRQVVEGQDGRRRASFDDEFGWWQRLKVSTQPGGEFKFEILTERARVESHLQSTQRNLVDRFLSRAAAAAYDPLLGKTLFELLIPNELKQNAPDRRDLVLMVDRQAAAYPWELLQDGANKDSRPMAVEAGMIRQLVSATFRPQPLMSMASLALVVGDPAADEPGNSPFSRLPGAAAEARQVSEQLNAAGYATVSLIGEEASALDVVTRLYEQPYRIVHIAAHGVFDQPVDDQGRIVRRDIAAAGAAPAQTRRVSGVVLGDGIYLTPSEFEQMRDVPELVFINCCHLGNLAGDKESGHVEYHRLAANIATQLITMGVRAVIAAGWAVDDVAAKLFASTFYERMFANNSFGDAVTEARRTAFAHEQRRGSNTWGAYQCYGDPEFRLVARTPTPAAGSIRVPLSPSELNAELQVLARRATYASNDNLPGMKEEFRQLVRLIPETWYDYGTVCSAVATVFAELGELELAAGYYQRANISERADAPIKSVEQLVNLKARWAIDRATRPNATVEDRKRALSELAEAGKIIDSLLAINESQERYAIKGSVHKRMSMLATASVQRKQLEEMAGAYDQAHALSVKKNLPNAFYSLQNSLAARIALSWGSAKKKLSKNQINKDLKLLARYLDNADNLKSDFWTTCREPDRQLLEAMSKQRLLEVEVTGIGEGYQAARQIGSTGREIKIISEHLNFFLCVARKQLKDEQKNQLCENIEKLREMIEEVS